MNSWGKMKSFIFGFILVAIFSAAAYVTNGIISIIFVLIIFPVIPYVLIQMHTSNTPKPAKNYRLGGYETIQAEIPNRELVWNFAGDFSAMVILILIIIITSTAQ